MISRFALAALAGALLFSSPSPAHADAVLAAADQIDPSSLDVQVAVGGGARWTRFRVSGPSRVLWLVPARPGAAIDWAPETFLDALEASTAPRVVPPDSTPPCGAPWTAERVEPHATVGFSSAKGMVLVHATESEVRAHAAARGFRVSTEMAARIAQVYAGGSELVSIEIETSSTTTTRTLRVTGDARTLVPLALTGSGNATTRVTAFVFGDTPVTIGGATDISGSTLMWGRARSNYRTLRDSITSKGGWVRESASHASLFGGFSVRTEGRVESLGDTYLDPSCVPDALRVSSTAGPIGRTCAPGDVAKIPGGALCADDIGDVEALRCGTSIDLALALQGLSPKNTSVTRLSGSIPRGALGDDLAVSTASESWPVVTAGTYETCGGSSGGAINTPSAPDPDTSGSGSASVVVVTHESCSGDTTSTTSDEPDGTESETTTSSGCSGDTTTTSTSSESGNDTSSDGDTCGGDSSTSSSSSGSSDEGWDTEDSDSSSSSKDSCGSSSSDAGAKSAAKRRPSKVSRYAMLLAFVVLPLRRRLRKFR